MRTDIERAALPFKKTLVMMHPKTVSAVTVCLLALAVGLSHGAAASAADLTPAQIVARAGLCARDFCKSSSEGCEFRVLSSDKKEWTVSAEPILRSETGVRQICFHRDCSYTFARDGTLLHEFQYPGLTKGCARQPELSTTCDDPLPK